MTAEDQSRYLRLAERLSEFRGKLRAQAETLDAATRQKILRMVVQEIVVGKDTLRIRHSIPVSPSSSGCPGNEGAHKTPCFGIGGGSYLLCTGTQAQSYR